MAVWSSLFVFFFLLLIVLLITLYYMYLSHSFFSEWHLIYKWYLMLFRTFDYYLSELIFSTLFQINLFYCWFSALWMLIIKGISQNSLSWYWFSGFHCWEFSDLWQSNEFRSFLLIKLLVDAIQRCWMNHLIIDIAAPFENYYKF